MDMSANERKGGTRTHRLLHLVQFLTQRDWTQEEIFQALPDFYPYKELPPEKRRQSYEAAERMLERDIHDLREMGFVVERTRSTRQKPAQMRLLPGTGPRLPTLFSGDEIQGLAFLYLICANPVELKPAWILRDSERLTGERGLLPPESAPHIFAQNILQLLHKLAATLPKEQRALFHRAIERPYVYFQIMPAINYLQHTRTIESIVSALLQRQKIQFFYQAAYQKEPRLHTKVDPYYIQYLDGHFYLIGLPDGGDKHLEYRLDRIHGEITILPDPIHFELRKRPILFQYWADRRLVSEDGTVSPRWISQKILREEPYITKRGQPGTRFLVEATAYSEFRILKQLLEYGDQVVLISPPALRQSMQDIIKRMFASYEDEEPQV